MLYDAKKNEEEILDFWDKNKCFEKSVKNRPEDKPYHFYDGPPFATGLPHYGHIVASLMKDIVPRYWTMRGFRVERRWGWDCHGLPVENIIEKELKLENKKDIEECGIEKFNEACRATVLKYANEWKKTIRRMGRWVDMENDYKTMDINFMESVWWVFKELWSKGLIYQGHKAMHICPHCATPLSNFEVTQNYKEMKDISVVVKFQITNFKSQINSKPQILNDKPIYILAWTTTPWTLPGNVLLAVNKNIKYQIVSIDGEDKNFILAKDRAEAILKNKEYKIIKEIDGSDLIGLEYDPLFSYFKNTPRAFKIVDADFVTTEEGTGVVHIAPAFGEDDYNVGRRENTPLVQHVTMEGKFTPEVVDFAGMEVKPKDDPSKADVEIIKWLAKENKLFSKESITHSYPLCWRCDAPLLNYATASWFVKIDDDFKKQLLKNNEKINWVPEHIKEGRFGKWLEGARDWAISRNRYWGTPLPVWLCQTGITNYQFSIFNESQNSKCDNMVAVGSVEELEKLSGQKIVDLHKHKIDDIEFKCEKCGGKMRRVPEVLDCWFESGSMPYGQAHYPFENKEKFENGFPAEFIAEGQDQTRGWFYTLHVLATALTSGAKPSIAVKESSPAFKNVIVNGIVLAEDGKKMSKRLKNYPEPDLILEKYGADALRYYFATSPVMEAESLNFSEAGAREMYNKVVNTLWNVVEFWKMFSERTTDNRPMPKNILDKWILAKLRILIKGTTKGMEEYKLADASRPILDFITELSQWYVRRSRDRFKGDDEEDKNAAIATLREVLLILSKVIAPFTPFLAEKVYREIKVADRGQNQFKESVHLEDWPEADECPSDKEILEQMNMARKIVEIGLAIRAEKEIKVKQPLQKLYVKDCVLPEEFKNIIADELNVKIVEYADEEENAIWKEDGDLKIGLDIEITLELKKEGLAREITRAINQIRKDKKLTMKDKVAVKIATDDELLKSVLVEFAEEIGKSVLAKEIKITEVKDGFTEAEVDKKRIFVKIISE
ncbi:MAG: isoleucine--tRNA ligase [Patescibacteria group bacterium]|nr:isoleucine--tRNA ligase [Patescibacteria group bacterium]